MEIYVMDYNAVTKSEIQSPNEVQSPKVKSHQMWNYSYLRWSKRISRVIDKWEEQGIEKCVQH